MKCFYRREELSCQSFLKKFSQNHNQRVEIKINNLPFKFKLFENFAKQINRPLFPIRNSNGPRCGRSDDQTDLLKLWQTSSRLIIAFENDLEQDLLLV